MTDYYDDDEPRRETQWVYFTDKDHRLARFCLYVAIAAIVGWVLIQTLNT